jgi:hypothetical protein
VIGILTGEISNLYSPNFSRGLAKAPGSKKSAEYKMIFNILCVGFPIDITENLAKFIKISSGKLTNAERSFL